METEQIHHHLTANAHMRKRDILVGNFLGGLAWGVGSVVGATIIVAILLGVLRNFNFLPGINDINNQLNSAVNSRIQTK